MKARMMMALSWLMLLTATAEAEERYWTAGIGFSYHWQDGYYSKRRDGYSHTREKRDFNDTHPILSYHDEKYAVAGYLFKNSYDEWTISFGKRWARRVSRAIEADLYLGAASGYPDTWVIAWVGLNFYPGASERYSAHLRISEGYVASGVAFRW